jgi:hypothetical protein
MGYNISDVGGMVTGGLDVWTFTGSIATNPSLTTVSGNFNVTQGANTGGEATNGYVFSPLSTNAYGYLTYNTTNGTWTFHIDRDALYDSNSNQTISFTITGTSGGSSDSDTVTINLLICVARGTLIQTPAGPVPVEALDAGDVVLTADGRAEALRWIGSRRVTVAELTADPDLRPVLISRDALGEGVPSRDLTVSPQHRILVTGWRAELFFGEGEVLVPAKALLNDHDIRTGDWSQGVEYFHLLLDRHEIILTDGAPTESFHPGRYTLSALGAAVQAELQAHLRGRAERDVARPVLSVREATVLGRRAA